MKQVVSLYDCTGIAVAPWAEAGFECYCYDQQNTGKQIVFDGGGSIHFRPWDATNRSQNKDMTIRHMHTIRFLSCFPPCTELTVAGANWFKRKAAKDPKFQIKAIQLVWVAKAMADYWDCPYYIENPVGVISTMWKKPNYKFHPYEYGGYLSEAEADHPIYSQITAKDEYPKKTCLWTGNGFVMPKPIYSVPPKLENKFASFHMKLSGWMDKKERSNIRSATPRGFSIAVFMANYANNIVR
jgi:hypothetical protein